MKYFERMEVYKKVPYSQVFEKDWANAHWNQVAKFAVREQRRRDKMANPEEDSSTAMTHVDVHRAYHTHTLCQKHTLSYRKRIRQGKSECVDIWSGTRQAASARQSEVGKAMCDINMNPGRASPCVLHQSEVDGTGLVHGDDLVIVTTRRHSKGGEHHLRSKWDVGVQTLGQRANGNKQIRVLNRTLTWGVTGIEYEADQRHVTTWIDKNLTSNDRPLSTWAKT